MDAAALKDQHRRVRDGQPEPLRVRIHRAISWLMRAEQEADDPDARYIFLWIAFNAAYASEFGFEQAERQRVKQFIDKLLGLDAENKLHHALFSQFSGPIRTLVENQHVFEPFWRALREHDGSGAWEVSFVSSKKVAMKALMGKETSSRSARMSAADRGRIVTGYLGPLGSCERQCSKKGIRKVWSTARPWQWRVRHHAGFSGACAPRRAPAP
ncbi:MAG: hypothetical protein WA961_02035 [Rhodanobacter sp.]